MPKKTAPVSLDRDWLSVKQTAEYLQLDAQTVRRYVADGKLTGRQLVAGGKILISASSIEKLLGK